MRFLLALLALLSIVTLSSAHEFKSKHTIELTKSTYANLMSSGDLYLVAYFAPWCGHCKKLAPTWVALGAKQTANPKVKIAFVDCTVHRDVCQKEGVKGYPTIKLIHNGAEAATYKGPRETSALHDFVQDQAKKLL